MPNSNAKRNRVSLRGPSLESCITKGMEVLVFVVLAAASDFGGSMSVVGVLGGGGLWVLGTKSG